MNDQSGSPGEAGQPGEPGDARHPGQGGQGGTGGLGGPGGDPSGAGGVGGPGGLGGPGGSIHRATRFRLAAYVFLVVAGVVGFGIVASDASQTRDFTQRTREIAAQNRESLAATAAVAKNNHELLTRECAYEHADFQRRKVLDQTILAPVHILTAKDAKKYGLTPREVYVANISKRQRNNQLAMQLHALLSKLSTPIC